MQIKINCVPVLGIEEQKLLEVAELAKNHNVHVRFIEMMPIGMGTQFAFVKEDALKQQLETLRSKIQPFSPVSVTSPRADSSVAPLNDSTCKEEIETLKKRIERMKEVFAAQTNRFRDAV